MLKLQKFAQDRVAKKYQHYHQLTACKGSNNQSLKDQIKINEHVKRLMK
jgi:hypothetical protein